jgi:ABC-type xylose transport system permease subunit
MFVLLFLVTLVVAFGVSYGIAKGSQHPMESVLHHFFAPHISAAFAKYLQLAIVLVGVCAGTRVRALQEHISATDYNKHAMLDQMTQEFWVMELYRTVIASFEGILWLIFLFALTVVVAVVIMRKNHSPNVHPAEVRPKAQTSGSAKSTS